MKRSFPRRVVDRLPRILVTDTSDAMFAIVMLGMGLATLIILLVPGTPSGVIGRSLTNDVLRVMWSVSFLGGGVFTLIGMQRESRSNERFGLALSALATFAYGSAMNSVGTPASVLLGTLIFYGMTIMFVIRLISAAAGKSART